MKLEKRTGRFDRRSLPTVIIARGQDIRYFTVRPWMVVVSGTLFAAMTIICVAATGYLITRDDLVERAAAQTVRMQQAYEDRIASLKAELDRVASIQATEQKLLQRKVTELLNRQERLSERHSWLSPILERAEQLNTSGTSVPIPTPRPEIRASSEAEQVDRAIVTGSAYAGVVAPRIPWPIRKGREQQHPARTDELFRELDRSLHHLETDQFIKVGKLTDETYQTIEAVDGALDEIGIRIASDFGEKNVGGPLMAISGTLPFEDRVRELDEALDRLERLKQTVRHIPIANPIPNADMTSDFGMRRDPILGRPAYHAGIDFRASPGSPVRAAAAGIVVHAGWKGGYGRMVEIDHGNGIRTRYAHLSKMLVSEGDQIGNGGVVAHVGSSGRSTGPHLHYEVRKDGAPVNPRKFISAGRRIAELL